MVPSLAYRLGMGEDAPEMMGLRDRYLESWTTFQSMSDLQDAFTIAYKLAAVNRSISHQQTLGRSAERYRIENDSISGWLRDLLEVVP